MDFFDLEEKYIAPTYGREPFALVEGDGVKVRDSEGNEYLDFVGGIAVCALGHSNPKVAKAISDQAGRLGHVSNLYHIPPQAELAKKLAGVTPGGIRKFFFCNSGTEAVEAALKLAVKHTGREKVLALEGSFHGRTSASLGVTWKSSYRDPFESLISSNFDFVKFDDVEAMREEVDEETAAVIAEPIQGEGGVNVPSDGYLEGLRDICDDENALLIFDEIQTGMCRTGEWFACNHWDVVPDIITMAKALGNGFPIGSMGAKPEVMDSFSPGDHASTFGGNPLACTAANKTIDIMKEENIPDRVEEIGGYFKSKLKDISEKHEVVDEVRGVGLILAMELEGKKLAEDVVEKAREDGFLINRTAKKVLRFVPPLILEKNHVDNLIDELNTILEGA